MNKSSRRLGVWLLALLVFTAVAVTLRTVACLTDLDFGSGYFNNKTVITVGDGFAAVGAVGAICYIFAEKKGLKFAASFKNAATYIPSGLVSVALLFLSASLLYDAVMINGHPAHISIITAPVNMLSIIIAILAIASIGAFVLRCLTPDKELAYRGWFDVVLIIFLALYTASLYFDVSTPLNSPAKVTDEMAYLLSAVFFLYEARISLGREMWRPYIGFGMAAALVSAYSAIPSIIVYFAKGEVISSSVAESVLTLMIFVFIVCRLVLILALPEDKACPTVEAVILMEKQREQLLEEESSDARENDIEEESCDEQDEDSSNYTFDIDGDSIALPEGEAREDG